MSTAIKFINVSKRFELDHNSQPRSLQETMIQFLSLRRRKQAPDYFWALRDVSFEIESGQTVGVLTQGVIRVVDMNLQRDLWTQVSATNLHEVQVQYLQQVQN